MIPKLVYCEWVDSTNHDVTWADDDSESSVSTVVTIGFLQKKTKESIVVSASFSEDEFLRPTVIPMGCITVLQRIELSDLAERMEIESLGEYLVSGKDAQETEI